MYLKSIEIHGFKSFANKIVFQFHNGITGIVGPNGSGKSNVADAVRWVLGEQRIKQLRGASMQDVIFSGTETRKPLSYAYVAITLDNSDHQLAIDYDEVTVARRIYRSGESEYLINGTPCRLKDVNELFYDTGIGKEGYSIIGQGQIDKILSGKPEERRELFDEAAGIVKFKRRKAAAQTKLENEKQNLVRVNDILSELEKQVGPLEKQSEVAKVYLRKKEELKSLDINVFLLENKRLREQLASAEEKYNLASTELGETGEKYEGIKEEYERIQQEIESLDVAIEAAREQLTDTGLMRGKLEGEINVLKEQINSAHGSETHLNNRKAALEEEIAGKEQEKQDILTDKKDTDTQVQEIAEAAAKAKADLEAIQNKITELNNNIEAGKNTIIGELNQRATIKSKMGRFDTMMEQINIRKAELNSRLLRAKSDEAAREETVKKLEETFETVTEELRQMTEQEAASELELGNIRENLTGLDAKLRETQNRFHQEQSKLEALTNITERYDGYGGSVKKVMEQKEKEKGIIGVVADIIQVEAKYETAIETALGGNIQNIVTEDEATAKKMIGFLKANHFGRATFLPLTSVRANRNTKNEAALGEKGVLGIANKLVKCDTKFDEVVAYLLGRVIVVDTIDNAIALAKKNHYSLHIVTVEGEYLAPGGSMSGGAFKNSSNLLARNREIEELEKRVDQTKTKLKELRARKDDIATAIALGEEDIAATKTLLQEKYIEQNTAQISVDRADQQKKESANVYEDLRTENAEIEKQLEEINQGKKDIAAQLEASKQREEQLEKENSSYSEILEKQGVLEQEASHKAAAISLELANITKTAEFAIENINRINSEIEKFDEQKKSLVEGAAAAKDDIKKKQADIDAITQTILASKDNNSKLDEELRESLTKKEKMSEDYRGFFAKQEEVSKKQAALDKELFRLNSQREKLKEASETQINYMWDEYELTPHAASELRNDAYDDLPSLKKLIAGIKDEIRRLGDVNVNAIEEYREISTRYEFLKGQHDDLIEAEKTLVGIIDELDSGMRKQFTEKFAEIQREFDKSFKQLFGGGHGSLELVEDEDILECGIRIVAQPPGKKLQNMMQMSGGEKALTAIALLFAIQALKPSPFCLLDEIEAALDDSNVSRYANYLNKLTKNTQFIVITHRRGTMAAADRLYGITMQEKGVSTLVSVNLIENDLTQ